MVIAVLVEHLGVEDERVRSLAAMVTRKASRSRAYADRGASRDPATGVAPVPSTMVPPRITMSCAIESLEPIREEHELVALEAARSLYLNQVHPVFARQIRLFDVQDDRFARAVRQL